MIRIRKKLNNNAGASMIIALALMLVCIVVSSIIISVAACGLSRNNERTAQQQEYLAISSAAELIVQELKAAGIFTGKEENQVPGCAKYLDKELETFVVDTGEGSITYSGYRLAEPIKSSAEMSFLIQEKKVGENPASYTHQPCPQGSQSAQDGTLSGNFQQLLQEACMYVMKEGTVYKADPSNTDRGIFYISVNGDETRIPTVKCQFTMDQNYNVSILITSTVTDSDLALTVTMNSSEITEQSLGSSGMSDVCTNVHKVLTIYPDGTVEENGHQFEKVSEFSSMKVVWSEPVISKGGQNE